MLCCTREMERPLRWVTSGQRLKETDSGPGRGRSPAKEVVCQEKARGERKLMRRLIRRPRAHSHFLSFL